MTDEQINTTIAEVCGIRKFNRHDGIGWMYKTNEGWETNCPNYCGDLNAMHEAERVLKTWDHFVNYHAWLGYCGGNKLVQLHECITATARERAEAFLRTLGKWEEGK